MAKIARNSFAILVIVAKMTKVARMANSFLPFAPFTPYAQSWRNWRLFFTILAISRHRVENDENSEIGGEFLNIYTIVAVLATWCWLRNR
jgi:hypothetical protein